MSNKQLRFVFIVPRFHTNLYFRVKALQDAGHDVLVLVLYKGQSEFYENIPIQQISTAWISKLFAFFSKKRSLKTKWELLTIAPKSVELKKEINNFNPDFIFIKGYLNLFLEFSIRACSRFKKKIIILTQTRKNHIKGSEYLLKLYHQYLSKIGVVSYVTPIKKNNLIFKQIGVLNGIYTPFVYPKQETDIKNASEKINILSIGKFVERKDQLLLLNSFLELRKTFHLHLTLIGEPSDLEYLDKIKAFIAEYNLEEEVSILNNIGYCEMPDIFSSHNIFILPSYGEPAAYSPVEAMAFGLPVVYSSDSGSNCYVFPNRNGQIFKAKSAKSLTEAITKIIKTASTLNQYKKETLSIFEKEHLPQRFSKDIIQLINRIG